MEVGETLYVSTQQAWRTWLKKHWDQSDEIWLVSYRKATGRPSLPYDLAVKEALCVGWIDSTRKSLDEDRYAQRFTPRRAGSGYSQTNLERLARLIEAGRVANHVLWGMPKEKPKMIEAAYQCRDCGFSWQEKILTDREKEEARRERLRVRPIRCPKCGSRNPERRG